MNVRALMLSVLAVTFITGCSSFNRDWRQAAEVKFEGVEGRWSGSWHSDYNQHNGPLRCLITKDTGDVYHARFHAKYKLGFLTVSYPYDMDMTITQKTKSYTFKGQADLGWWAGGDYQYDGNGTADNIKMNYRAKVDFGTFKLERPKDN